jgi:hypothetical protein
MGARPNPRPASVLVVKRFEGQLRSLLKRALG